MEIPRISLTGAVAFRHGRPITKRCQLRLLLSTMPAKPCALATHSRAVFPVAMPRYMTSSAAHFSVRNDRTFCPLAQRSWERVGVRDHFSPVSSSQPSPRRTEEKGPGFPYHASANTHGPGGSARTQPRSRRPRTTARTPSREPALRAARNFPTSSS